MNHEEKSGFTAELDQQIRQANDIVTAKLADLPLECDQEAEIKGGLLPAVQKVRAAAARLS